MTTISHEIQKRRNERATFNCNRWLSSCKSHLSPHGSARMIEKILGSIDGDVNMFGT